MRLAGQPRPAQPRERLDELHDGVVAGAAHSVRARGMPGRSRGRQPQPQRALLGDEHSQSRGLAHEDGVSARERTRRDEAPRADTARALARAESEQQIAAEPGAVGGDAPRRLHHRREPALHVGRPAAVDAIDGHVAREGRMRPLAFPRGHRIEVCGEHQRGSLARSRHPAEHVGTSRRELIDDRSDTARFEPGMHEPCELDLAPGRILGGMANDGPEQADQVVVANARGTVAARSPRSLRHDAVRA